MFKTVLNDNFNWLNSLNGFKLDNYNLNSIFNLLKRINNPEKKLKFIHIVGTNGKGSVSKLCHDGLVESGKKTGLFISPHILNFNERIQINGNLITNKALINLIEFIKPIVEDLTKINVFCSQFDVIFAIALKYFELNFCDIIVLEAGLGGRFDSTNAIDCPEIAVFTKIALDHEKELGNSLEKIALEKAAIIKPGCLCVCSDNEPDEVFQILKQTCLNKKAKLIKSYNVSDEIYNGFSSSFCFDKVRFELNLGGAFQIENAKIALTVLLNLNVSLNIIKKAFKKTFWPARFECVHSNPTVILDGAHNYDGFVALTTSINLFKNSTKIGIISMLSRKNYKLALKQVIKMNLSELILTQMDGPDVAPVEILADVSKKIGLKFCVEPNWKDALNLAEKKAATDGLILIFGSLYFVSQVRNIFK